MSTTNRQWADGVRIVRAVRLRTIKYGPSSTGRGTAFDFLDTGGKQTWIGSVTLHPGSAMGAHHHGHHEVVVCVAAGRSEIRWGDGSSFDGIAVPVVLSAAKDLAVLVSSRVALMTANAAVL